METEVQRKARFWPHLPGDPKDRVDCTMWTNCVVDHAKQNSIKFVPWVPTTDTPTFGVEKGAEVRVTVHTYEDGERVVDVECLCGACFEIDNVGVEDSMGGEELPEGIHYLESWHEEFHFAEGTEWDGGLRHTEATDAED